MTYPSEPLVGSPGYVIPAKAGIQFRVTRVASIASFGRAHTRAAGEPRVLPESGPCPDL